MPSWPHKAAYLNVPFFLGRAAFYFVIWAAFAGDAPPLVAGPRTRTPILRPAAGSRT